MQCFNRCWVLNGLFLNFSSQEIFGVATDGHRLAKSGSEAEENIEEALAPIVPRKGIIEIEKQIKGRKKQRSNKHF